MPRNNWWLIAILALGLALRIIFLTKFPPSLNWDEVSLGYNAYSLLKTGRDEWGQAWPTIFRAFGDYKLPVYIYLATVAQALFGQSELGVRFVSVISGVLSILVIYLIGHRVHSQKVGLWSALVMAIIPWSLFLSRVALEANVAILFLSLGLYCLISNKHNQAILFFGISVWTYNSARVFIPLFLFIYWLINHKKIRFPFSTIIIGAVFFVPMFWQLLRPIGQARYQTLTLLDPGAISEINILQQKPGGRLLYNKATYFGYKFLGNYFSYLSPQFLFTEGGSHYQFSIPKTGLLYLSLLPFLLLGLFKSGKNQWLWLWLLISPVAGSVTRDSPHTLRAIVMLPILPFLISLGIVEITKKIKFMSLVVIAILVVEMVNYGTRAKQYYLDYSWAWQFGYKQVVNFIKDNYSKYDQVLFTKRYAEPHEFVAYYWPWNPRDYQMYKIWDYHDSWYWINGLDKFTFVNDWEIQDKVTHLSREKPTLVVYSPENEGPGREVFRVNFLDNKPAFIAKEL